MQLYSDGQLCLHHADTRSALGAYCYMEAPTHRTDVIQTAALAGWPGPFSLCEICESIKVREGSGPPQLQALLGVRAVTDRK